MDFLINNLEQLNQPTGIVKASPVSEICALAREIALINDKMYKYSQPPTPVIPKGTKITQTNLNIKTDDKDNDFHLEDIDNMIKNGKLK